MSRAPHPTPTGESQTAPFGPIRWRPGGFQARPGAPLPTRAAWPSAVKQVLQSSAASVTLWGEGLSGGAARRPVDAPSAPPLATH